MKKNLFLYIAFAISFITYLSFGLIIFYLGHGTLSYEPIQFLAYLVVFLAYLGNLFDCGLSLLNRIGLNNSKWYQYVFLPFMFGEEHDYYHTIAKRKHEKEINIKEN